MHATEICRYRNRNPPKSTKKSVQKELGMPARSTSKKAPRKDSTPLGWILVLPHIEGLKQS